MVALAKSPVALVDNHNVARNQDLELTLRLDDKTYRQVRNLKVVRNDEQIVLRGQSCSFYVKQLATHAALDLFPGMNIENAIAVLQ